MKLCSSCARVLPESARECPADGGTVREVSEVPVGARLGAYRVSRLLGEGGMGSVYEAHHEELGRRAALKLLRPELVENRGVVVRFLQEARAVNLIRHDHIIDVYDYGDGAEGAVYFVMEYLEGEDLGAFLRRRGQVEAPLWVHIFSQIAEALAAAHAKEVIHRDLKPANVFLIQREDDPFFAKLLDFGVAKLSGEGAVPGLTRAGALIGTPQYMAPEQVQGGEIDSRADLFAVGVMMYRACTGIAPFRGDAFSDLARAIMQEPHEPIATAAPDADARAGLAEIVDRALAKNPDERFQTAQELLTALAELRDEVGPADLQSARAEPSRPRRRDPRASATNAPGAILGESIPEYQGAPAAPQPRPASAPSPSPSPLRPGRVPRIVFAAAGAVALASAVALGFGLAGTSAGGPERADASAGAPASDAIAEELAALAQGGAAERQRLLSALEMAGTARAAPVLYDLLEGPPQARVRSAEILAALELPEAAPRIREALSRSGQRVRIDLAISLIAAGDRDAASVLDEASQREGATALAAAVALAEAGSPAARGVIEDVFDRTPKGRPRWRLAARGLMALGVEAGGEALRGELAHRDPERSVAAAEALATAGDAEGVAFLRRVAADGEHAGRAEAALVLAKEGEPAGLGFVADGLDSDDPEARALAAAIAGHLARAGGRDHAEAIAAMAADDPSPTARLTAKVALLALE